MKFRNSLLFKYLLIICIAVVLVPILFTAMSVLLNVLQLRDLDRESNPYRNGIELERMWQAEAGKLAGADDERIDAKLAELKEAYPKASLFWVDERGETKLKLPDDPAIPSFWTPAYTIQYMKDRYDNDPFTVIAFIGQNRENGFLVFQLSRSAMQTPVDKLWASQDYITVAGALVVLGLFLFISCVFFYRIRSRLLGLEQAMTDPSATGIPSPIEVNNPDEIGRLEKAFNTMIGKLKASRRREKEEEHLRRQLIANLSHDLRTPLTSIRGHAYSLKEEALSEKGRQSISLIERKTDYLAELIDNLLSCTLLAAGKYPSQPERTDMVRLIRTLAANWYPVFEREQFHVDLKLPETSVICLVDPKWIERILDNLFQNVLRHAKSGLYIAVRFETGSAGAAIRIEDRGPGMNGRSTDKGAGIGLTIVQLMLKEMKLNLQVDSDGNGTRMTIGGLTQI